MTNALITEIETLLGKLKAAVTPAVETAEADVVSAGKATLDYIKTNGLQDLYQIALTVVGAAATGSPWGGVLTSIEAQATADLSTLGKGAVAVVAAQAQADLIATGKLMAPASAAPGA